MIDQTQATGSELLSLVRRIMHDVNNPLCVINLSLNRLETVMDAQPHPELSKSYEEISASADKLLEIMSRLDQARAMIEESGI